MKVVEYVSYLMIPLMILCIVIYGISKKQKIYEDFIEGAGEGLGVVIKIFPSLIAILVAVGIFRESGGMDMLSKIILPISRCLGVPKEVVPLGVMSSISGGASFGLLSDTLNTYGPDSLIGKIASTILGSSETTLYVLAVYTSVVNIKDIKGALWIGLLCDLVAICVAVLTCKLLV